MVAAAARKQLSAKSNGRNGSPRGRRLTRPPRIQWTNIEVPSQATSGARVNSETVLTFPGAYRSVVIIAGAIASMPLRVYRRVVRYGREVGELAPDHPVDALLRLRPNHEQRAMRWKEFNTGCLAIRGNAYNEIVVPETTVVGEAPSRIGGIYPLHPDRVTVRRDDETRELEYWYQGDDRARYLIPTSRMLHFALFGDDILGKSPVSLFRESIGLALAGERHAASTIGKGLSPSGALTHPGELGDDAFNRLDQHMNRRHAGPDNAGRVLILEDGMTWANIGFNLKDSQFLEQRGFQIEEASRIWGVPTHLLSLNNALKYNNVEQLDIDFVKHTLLAYMLRVEEEIDFKLLGGTGEYYCKFNAKGLLRGDIKTRYEAHAIGRQWGWLSANDVREIEDMDPLDPEVGDIYLSPVNMVPAEKAGLIGQPQPGEAKPESTEDRPREARAAKVLRSVFADAVRRLLFKEMQSLEAILRKHRSALPADAAFTDKELCSFYDDRFGSVVRDTLGPAWTAIGESDGRAVSIDAASDKYVAQARAIILGAFRHGERAEVERVLAAWRQCRADMVVTEFMEACYAPSDPQ